MSAAPGPFRAAVTVIPLGNAMSSATSRTEPSAVTSDTDPGLKSSPATGLNPLIRSIFFCREPA